MNKLLCTLLLAASFNTLSAVDDIVGFWKTIDDKTKKPESILAIYEYQGKFYGRLIATYNEQGQLNDTIDHPVDRAPGVEGHPYYSGLDILWDLQKDGNKYDGGTILNPESGSEYEAEAWTKNGNLVVRGEILFLGRNQTWPRATDADFPQGFNKPDLTKFVPVIPKVHGKS